MAVGMRVAEFTKGTHCKPKTRAAIKRMVRKGERREQNGEAEYEIAVGDGIYMSPMVNLTPRGP